MKSFQVGTLFALLFLSAFAISGTAYGDAVAPRIQIKSGIPTSDVTCNEDLIRLFNVQKDKVRCVKSSSVDLFVKRGWSIAPDLAPEVAEISDSIKKISVTKTESLGVKKSETAVYDYVFEVCAGSITLVAPEVIIKSDVQTKTIILADDIPRNSCYTTAAAINAVKADSIRSELAKQDDIVAKISSIKSEIDERTTQLEAEKKNFAQILTQQKTDGKQQKIDESNSKINTLRQAMNDLKDDLNRYYFILYGAPQKSSSIPKTSFAGSEVTGNSVKIISISNSPKTGAAYDVVLELCAGQNQISTPIVDLASDTKQSTLKLTTVASKSCYKTGAKIEAKTPDSITAKFKESTNTIASIENIIKDLDAKLDQKRVELKELTEKTDRPDAKKIRQLNNEITALRDEIVKAKSQYYQTLYNAYK